MLYIPGNIVIWLINQEFAEEVTVAAARFTETETYGRSETEVLLQFFRAYQEIDRG